MQRTSHNSPDDLVFCGAHPNGEAKYYREG